MLDIFNETSQITTTHVEYSGYAKVTLDGTCQLNHSATGFAQASRLAPGLRSR